MKAIEKRAPRSYKARQTPYVKAARRAKKEDTTLAALIEEWVTCYGNGMEIARLDVHYGEIKSLKTKSSKQ